MKKYIAIMVMVFLLVVMNVSFALNATSSDEQFKAYVGIYESDTGVAVITSDRGRYYIQKDFILTELIPVNDEVFTDYKGRLYRLDGESLTIEEDSGESTVMRRSERFTEQEIEFISGDVIIRGTLVLPEGTGPFPLVVFTHGSLTNERDYYYNYGYHFLEEGFVVFLYDKRGSGTSTGDLKKASLNDLASDAANAAMHLSGLYDIDGDNVGLFGLGQGGRIVAIAGASENVDFIISASGGGVNIIDQKIYRIDQRYEGAEFSYTLRKTAQKFWHMAYDLSLQFDKYAIEDRFGIRDYLGSGTDPYHEWTKLRDDVDALLIYGNDDAVVPVSESIVNISRALRDSEKERFNIYLLGETDHGMKRTDVIQIDESVQVYNETFFDIMLTWTKLKTGRDDRLLPYTETNHDTFSEDQLPPKVTDSMIVATFGSSIVQLPLLILFFITAIVGMITATSGGKKGKVEKFVGFMKHAVLFALVILFAALVLAVIYPRYPQTPGVWINVIPILSWVCIALIVLDFILYLRKFNDQDSVTVYAYTLAKTLYAFLIFAWLGYWHFIYVDMGVELAAFLGRWLS